VTLRRPQQELRGRALREQSDNHKKRGDRT
jgi:hypothetical protein